MSLRGLFIHSLDLGWSSLASQLRASVDASDQIDATHYDASTSMVDRIALRYFRRRQWSSPTQLWTCRLRSRFARSIESGRYDFLYGAGQGFAAAVAEACRQSGVPFAVSIDTTGPIYRRDLLRLPDLPIDTWSVEAAVYRDASLVFCWSEWAAASVVGEFGVDREKVVITPPAVNVIARAARGARKLPRIVFVGNDWDRKGGGRLLAWHRARWADRCELHIVSARAPRRIGYKNVIVHGRLPRAEVLGRVLPSCDVFCLPTRHDMSPFALAEAQAAGLPCVASRLAGIPDLVLHERTGILCDPEDDDAFVHAIERLIGDAELRSRMSNAAADHAARSLDAQTVYRSAIERLTAMRSPALA